MVVARIRVFFQKLRSQILRAGVRATLGRSVISTGLAHVAPIGHIENIEEVTPSNVENVNTSNRCIYQMVNTFLDVEDMVPMMSVTNIYDLVSVTKGIARYAANKIRARTGRRAKVMVVGAIA
jgi:hypothetical protein